MILSSAIRQSADVFASRAVEELLMHFAAALPPAAREELSISKRLKSENSISAKMQRRRDYTVVNDFIGIRIVVLHVGLVTNAVAIVKAWAEASGLILHEQDDRFQTPGLATYRSVHLDFRFLNPERLGLTPRCGIEIQITTFLQRFHEVFSHALLYKEYADANANGPIVERLTLLSEQLASIDYFASELLPSGSALADKRR
jgi:ppGpp synthetase/RelA/SpoT-type nucleotidyltranferase